jgi:hypothetical protein
MVQRVRHPEIPLDEHDTSARALARIVPVDHDLSNGGHGGRAGIGYRPLPLLW